MLMCRCKNLYRRYIRRMSDFVLQTELCSVSGVAQMPSLQGQDGTLLSGSATDFPA